MASICVFCCTRNKIIDGNSEEKVTPSLEIINTFLKVTQSHFGINFTNIIDQQDNNFYNSPCLKCEQSVKLICQLYDKLEGIRLKLEWNFGELISKMKAVGRTPSKVKWFRENQSACDFQKMVNFRNDFIVKCNQSLSRSAPAVILHQTKRHSGGFPDEPIDTNEVNEDETFPSFSNSDNSNDINETTNRTFMDNVDMATEKTGPPSPPVINDLDKEDKLPTLKPVKCPHCPVRFSHQNSLRRHLRKFHQPNRKKSQSIAKTKPVKKSTITNKKRESLVPCKICQLPLGNRKILQEFHFDLHHSTKGMDPKNIQKCDHANCSAYFRTLFQLTRHKKSIHGENDKIAKTTCPICSKICSEYKSVKTHMKTQHNDESSDLPLACEVLKCPKRFPTEAILKWHQMYYNHSNRKQSFEPIRCSECQKDFHGLAALKKHQKTHQQPEAPYVCELCGAAFKRKSILREHGSFHVDPDNWQFECDKCGKKCATKHKLQDHMKVHSDDKLFFCEVCGKGFKCRQKLRKHVNKFHAQEGFQDVSRKREKPKLISRRAAT